MPAGFGPREPWRDPRHQLVELRLPSLNINAEVYAGGSSHRAIFACPHNSR